MADKSKIEWTEATLNPWTGCTKVSPGCANCYIARTPPFRTKGRDFVKGRIPLEFNMERLDRMLRRRKPTMYFVNSLSDVFHEDASERRIAELWAAMARAEQHTFQILTKRPLRAFYMLNSRMFWEESVPHALGHDMPTWYMPGVQALRNVWLGTSIENRRFVKRADILRDIPAAVRFISAEPLLGPLVYDAIVGNGDYQDTPCWSDDKLDKDGMLHTTEDLNLGGIDWLIVGGESGPGHRPMKLNWCRDLRDAARASGTAFFMKQLGGDRPGNSMQELPPDLCIREYPTSVRPDESYEQMTLA